MIKQQSDSADALERLTMDVEGSADWREEKARQYPEDDRNVTSAQSLRKLAKKLAALKTDDRHLVGYAKLIERVDAADSESANQEIFESKNQYIGRYGFDCPEDGNPADFLDGLIGELRGIVEDAEKEAAEAQRAEEYEAVRETADEAAKEAAEEAAKEAAEEAAKEAADEAYREAYDEAYKEVYAEAYREALIEAMARQSI